MVVHLFIQYFPYSYIVLFYLSAGKTSFVCGFDINPSTSRKIILEIFEMIVGNNNALVEIIKEAKTITKQIKTQQNLASIKRRS